MTGLYYELSGRKDGPVLLLVHGFMSSRAQWMPNLAALGEIAQLAVVELLGHGRSPAPAEAEPYQVTSYVAAFDDIRRAIGAPRMFVCGQSFGAGLTIAYALAHPSRTCGHIFTNSRSALAPPGQLGDEATRAAEADRIEAGGASAIDAMALHPRNARRAPADAREAMVRDAALLSPRGLANSMRHTLPQLSMLDRLAGVQAPGLLINGIWEKAFQPLRALAAERAPGLEIMDLEGGHSINLEAPEAFNRALGNFIRRHDVLD